jgi:hypothetical protein
LFRRFLRRSAFRLSAGFPAKEGAIQLMRISDVEAQFGKAQA